jgi:hypothetical protein
MEVSTGCHHTSNHSATLGATYASSAAVQDTPKNQSERALASDKNQQDEATSPQDSSRSNDHHHHRPGSHRSRSHGGHVPRGQFGFAVNGFHPQWSTSSNILLSSQARDITAFPVSLHNGQPSLNEQVATATNDLITRLRNDEEEKKNIRKRHLAEVAVASAKAQKKRELENPKAEESSGTNSSSGASTTSTGGKQKLQSFSSLYGDVFLKSCTAQILVSPGGRILAWNDRFVEISELNADQIADSLTVFNLVQPKYIPRLFDLFAFALRGGSPPPLVLQQSPLAPGNMLGLVSSTSSGSSAGSMAADTSKGDDTAGSNNEDDNHCGNDDSSSEESRSTVVSSSEEEEGDGNIEEKEKVEEDDNEYHHASMTVPCAHFPSAKEAVLIMTITLMNDENPNKRCFHCVFREHKSLSQTCRDESKAKIDQYIDPSSFGKIRCVACAELAIQL